MRVCAQLLRPSPAPPAIHFSTQRHTQNPQVAADAFETLTAILTTNKPLVFQWLNPDGNAASLAR